MFIGNGTWNQGQIDPSYDGSPARFVAEDGAIAQQGFASAEPYTYEHVFEEWGKPVAYQTLHDAGFQTYSQTLSVREADLEELRPCLEQLVPIIQQSATRLRQRSGSGQRDHHRRRRSVRQLLGVRRGARRVLGGDAARARPRRQRPGRHARQHGGGADPDRHRPDPRRRGLDVPADLVAADLFTNDFIDPDIGL